MFRFSTLFVESDESDSTNPIIVIKHPTSPLHLKDHLFYYLCYSSYVLNRRDLYHISHQIWFNFLLLQCLLTGVNFCAENGHGMLSYDPLGVKVAWGQSLWVGAVQVWAVMCICSHVLPHKLWRALSGKDAENHCPRHPPAPPLWSSARWILTPSQVLSVCTAFSLSHHSTVRTSRSSTSHVDAATAF